LIVDDDRDLAWLLSFRLTSRGYSVLIAQDGKEGLEKTRLESPDLVILDLMLPLLPGEEVCRQIRKDPVSEKIPIIMLTAKGSDVDKVVGKVIGADHYVQKPFESEELLSLISHLLSE